MPNNVFLACFLACLLAVAIVAVFVWQVGGWFMFRMFRSMGITRQTMTTEGGVQISADTDPRVPGVQVTHPPIGAYEPYTGLSAAEVAAAIAATNEATE